MTTRENGAETITGVRFVTLAEIRAVHCLKCGALPGERCRPVVRYKAKYTTYHVIRVGAALNVKATRSNA